MAPQVGLESPRKLFKTDQTSFNERLHHEKMKTKDLTREQAQELSCPTCGARRGEACELSTGMRRTNPHRDRLLHAAEEFERERIFLSALRGRGV
jgi:hypothetical protein